MKHGYEFDFIDLTIIIGLRRVPANGKRLGKIIHGGLAFRHGINAATPSRNCQKSP
jgi:hypothetical protein